MSPSQRPPAGLRPRRRRKAQKSWKRGAIIASSRREAEQVSSTLKSGSLLKTFLTLYHKHADVFSIVEASW
jgi:hypothetical protein